jgi:hypothetical protein
MQRRRIKLTPEEINNALSKYEMKAVEKCIKSEPLLAPKARK